MTHGLLISVDDLELDLSCENPFDLWYLYHDLIWLPGDSHRLVKVVFFLHGHGESRRLPAAAIPPTRLDRLDQSRIDPWESTEGAHSFGNF